MENISKRKYLPLFGSIAIIFSSPVCDKFKSAITSQPPICGNGSAEEILICFAQVSGLLLFLAINDKNSKRLLLGNEKVNTWGRVFPDDTQYVSSISSIIFFVMKGYFSDVQWIALPPDLIDIKSSADTKSI